MRTYRLASHTADVKLRVAGDTLAELFTASLEGMNEILKRGFCRSATQYPLARDIDLVAYDTTALLIDFLSEALTLSHIDNAVFCRVEFTRIEGDSLSARISGAGVDKFDRDVKAVSYHEAEVKKGSKGSYQTNIVFDI
ncbi:MAG: archease [Bacteroidetes bacterium]|nr:archease [Bacteroidota bacterium]MCL5027257.1 archease [Chloroflexota bacterium]